MAAPPLTPGARALTDRLPNILADLFELALLADGAFDTANDLVDDVAAVVSQRSDACRRRNKTRAQALQQLYDRLVAGRPADEDAG